MFDAGAPYAQRLETVPFEPALGDDATLRGELLATQRGFGYTREDVKMILQPMAAEGKDAVWSMGDDTPLAFLARSPRPVYAYLPPALCAGDEPGDRSAARGVRGLAAYAAWAVVAHAG